MRRALSRGVSSAGLVTFSTTSAGAKAGAIPSGSGSGASGKRDGILRLRCAPLRMTLRSNSPKNPSALSAFSAVNMPPMSRARALLIVTVVWAAIYLPRLGSLELKSEEGRRVLPAVTMLDTGNYLVPQIGSDPYLRKPPLVNWLVAGSFRLFGAQNEWTARLPSVLCVLGVALAFVLVARRQLGGNGAIAAALMWLTNFGLLEKGRMIEIEALYVSLSALAFICWLSCWRDRRWLAWDRCGRLPRFRPARERPAPSFLFLCGRDCGALAGAGAEATCELAAPRRPDPDARDFCSLGDSLFGIGPQLICRARLVATTDRPTRRRGFQIRALDRQYPARALLPAAVGGAAAVRAFCIAGGGKRAPLLLVALSLGIAVPFLIVSLLPSALPRYNMPLLAPAIWLLAIFIKEHALVWPKPLRKAITWTVGRGRRRDADLLARAHPVSGEEGKNSPARRAARRGDST